jgi:putative ABC transport system substrate-binding protein
MKRRTLLLLGALGALAAAPAALAQQPGGRGTIGYLHYRTLSASNTTLIILRKAWGRLGYIEGQTIHMRAANGDPRVVPALAEELIRLGAGVLIVVGAEAVRAAKQAVPNTPIVAIDLETDPVRAGLAASFAKPGGNVTGLFLDLPSLAGKWIQLLQELDPRIERIAFSWDASTGRDQLDVALAVAREMGVNAEVVETTSYDFAAAFRRLGDDKRTGVVQLTSPGFGSVASDFAAETMRHRWPAIGFLKVYAQLGVPIAYGPDQEAYFSRAADIADRILAGARAGDIPIEQPTKFELALNLKSIKALGIEVPATLLARADEVVE